MPATSSSSTTSTCASRAVEAAWKLKFDQYERVDSVLITYGSVNTLAMISFRSWMVRVGIFEDRFKNENLLLGICTFNLVID